MRLLLGLQRKVPMVYQLSEMQDNRESEEWLKVRNTVISTYLSSRQVWKELPESPLPACEVDHLGPALFPYLHPSDYNHAFPWPSVLCTANSGKRGTYPRRS